MDYEILNRNTVTAVWRSGELKIINIDLLPLFLKRVRNADMWLETRAIDSHRANSRLLKKALRLAEKDDLSTVIHVNGVTITDGYWVRPIGSGLTYDDVRFSKNYFSTLALKGTYNSFNKASSQKETRTPELTNTGSFEKCWKLKDGRWYLIKRAGHSEQFSELFVFELGKALGMNMASYERGENCVISVDFTENAKYDFEPAFAFMGENDDYEATVEKMSAVCPAAIPDYVRMIFLDTVCANPDRHTNNFGLLRDPLNGAILGLAPNYDNNMALISRGYPQMPTKNDFLIKLFNGFIEVHGDYKKYLPLITEDTVTVKKVLSKINMKVKNKYISDLIYARYSLINKD